MDNMAGFHSGKELLNLTLKHPVLALQCYTKSNCITFNPTQFSSSSFFYFNIIKN